MNSNGLIQISTIKIPNVTLLLIKTTYGND